VQPYRPVEKLENVTPFILSAGERLRAKRVVKITELDRAAASWRLRMHKGPHPPAHIAMSVGVTCRGIRRLTSLLSIVVAAMVAFMAVVEVSGPGAGSDPSAFRASR
jgi:hypothetical protein